MVAQWANSNGPTDDATKVFDRIYQKSLWGRDGGGSGPGSTVENAAQAARILRAIVFQTQAAHVLDAGCGAFQWQAKMLPSLLLALPSLQYTGYDASQTVVQRNRATVASWEPSLRSRVAFEHRDLEHVVLPNFDLVFCREALQHSSPEAVCNILRTFARSSARHVLVTNFPNGSLHCGGPVNRRIVRGGFSCIDLAQPPYALRPQSVHPEHSPDRKVFYLYPREDLARQLNSSASCCRPGGRCDTPDRRPSPGKLPAAPRPRQSPVSALDSARNSAHVAKLLGDSAHAARLSTYVRASPNAELREAARAKLLQDDARYARGASSSSRPRAAPTSKVPPPARSASSSWGMWDWVASRWSPVGR